MIEQAVAADSAGIIRRAAHRLVGRAGHQDADRWDLRQRLSLEVLRRASRYEPDRGPPNAFVTHLVAHAASDIVAEQRAQIRDYRRAAGSIDGGGQLEREADCARTRRAEDKPEACLNLKLDINTVVARLPEPLRAICEHLKVHTVARTARDLGISRDAIYRAMDEVRCVFLGARLDEYL